jgi:hypothetical protein
MAPNATAAPSRLANIPGEASNSPASIAATIKRNRAAAPRNHQTLLGRHPRHRARQLVAKPIERRHNIARRVHADQATQRRPNWYRKPLAGLCPSATSRVFGCR